MIAARAWKAAAAVLAIVLPVGCAIAPMQEMSDARQSVQAAYEAGARDYASHHLKTAVSYLQDAERELELRYFSRARHDAVVARSEALKARNVTLAIKSAEDEIEQSDAPEHVIREATALLLDAMQAAAEGRDNKAIRLADEAMSLIKQGDTAPN